MSNPHPVPAATNPESTTRGHDERPLGRKLVYCLACGKKKPPRGGWSTGCTADKRAFMGGE